MKRAVVEDIYFEAKKGVGFFMPKVSAYICKWLVFSEVFYSNNCCWNKMSFVSTFYKKIDFT